LGLLLDIYRNFKLRFVCFLRNLKLLGGKRIETFFSVVALCYNWLKMGKENKTAFQKANAAVLRANDYFLLMREDLAEEFLRRKAERKDGLGAASGGADPVEYADFLYGNANFKEYAAWLVAAQRFDRAHRRKLAGVWWGMAVFLAGAMAVSWFLAEETDWIAAAWVVAGAAMIFGVVYAVFGHQETGYAEFFRRSFTGGVIFGAAMDFTTAFARRGNVSSYEACQNMVVKDARRTLMRGVLWWRMLPLTLPIRLSRKERDKEVAKVINEAIDLNATAARYTARSYNQVTFAGDLSAGRVADLDLRLKSRVIFSGVYYDVAARKIYHRLRGNAIQIRANENWWATTTETTLHAVHDSKYNHHFVDEKLNRALDCRVSGFKGFANLEEMHFEATRIMTASFEERMLFLYKRYNAFNLTFSDTGLNFNVTLRRGAYAKMKRGEWLDFKKTYAEMAPNCRLPECYDRDFLRYYRVFPMMERVYLAKYLSCLWYAYMDGANYQGLAREMIDGYEPKIVELEGTDWKEFRRKFDSEMSEVYNKAKLLKVMEVGGNGSD
jgi:hypothetical protein